VKKRRQSDLGRRIHAARAKRGFTSTVLAAYCGVTELAARGWEAGAQPKPNLTYKIAEALGVDHDLLVAGGTAWDEHILHIKRVSSPDIFRPPTQWPDELGAERDEAGAAPFRQHEEVAPPSAEPEASTLVSQPAAERPIFGNTKPCLICGTIRGTLFGLCTQCVVSQRSAG
jgi:transcriptional regulator with XRE-family HTH domain